MRRKKVTLDILKRLKWLFVIKCFHLKRFLWDHSLESNWMIRQPEGQVCCDRGPLDAIFNRKHEWSTVYDIQGRDYNFWEIS